MARCVDRFEDNYCLFYTVRWNYEKARDENLLVYPPQWINENLEGYWDTEHVGQYDIDYHFELEGDALAFKLVWV